MKPLSQSVLKTLTYADLFDFPLTLSEIYLYLITPPPTSLARVEKEINRLPKLIDSQKDYFFLKGKDETVSLRQKKAPSNQKKLLLAQKSARLLKIIPWVQAVLVTGALARQNASPQDDIDWLIITSPRRLWLTRFLTVSLLQFLGRRRRPRQQKVQDKICLNLFLDQNQLLFPPSERHLFTAHEILQSRLLWQRNDVYFRLLKANSWTKNYLPHAFAKLAPKHLPSSQRRNSPSLSSILDFLEKIAFQFQLAYMKPKKTIEKVSPHRALFHPQDISSWVLTEYQKRLSRLGIKE